MSDDERLVSVRQVADEATATMLCDFLRANGVAATAVAVQIPWLPGVETMRRGYWGHIEVLERDVDQARALIEDFYAGEPLTEPGQGNGADSMIEDDEEERQ